MTSMSDLRGIFSNQGSTATTGTAGAGATGGTQSVKPASGMARPSGATFQGIDQSALSLTATALSSASADSDVRMDKVQQLQAAIANGTYHVSSSDVANKLIQSMLGQ